MLRPACPTDAAAIADLVAMADPLSIGGLTGLDDPAAAMAAYRALVQSASGVASHLHARVFEQDGRVIGVVVAYPGRLVVADDIPAEARVTEAGDFYIDNVAVFPEHRGQGIARRLIEAAETTAIGDGFPAVSLIVDERNHDAFTVYDRLGYAISGRAVVRGEVFHRMRKPLPAGAGR
ncbi:N-acetyltransferase [Tistrella bauzanensis]|uniref:N-acetyltransferase n=1 Tax=Tistrella bauzanensis TaxID=657419 RepID=A0ABQ1J625_9PROT|nr:GNAT family N-acetyltransferase [Tistrella bauzanensis]GGB58710.1 N-acetyltransferase [Tistrella bauzanensis]